MTEPGFRFEIRASEVDEDGVRVITDARLLGTSVSADPRQPAYDAVFQEIREHGQAAPINAFIWRCVHAALNAANVGDPVDPGTGMTVSMTEI